MKQKSHPRLVLERLLPSSEDHSQVTAANSQDWAVMSEPEASWVMKKKNPRVFEDEAEKQGRQTTVTLSGYF